MAPSKTFLDFQAFREELHKRCDVAQELRTELLCEDTEKRIPVVHSYFMAPLESCIILLSFLDEYSQFKDSDDPLKAGLWDHQGMQLACSHVPHILWWVGRNYNSVSFKNSFSGNEHYDKMRKFGKALCTLAKFYHDAFPTDRNDTIDENENVIEADNVDSSKRGQRLKDITDEIWKEYEKKPRLRTSKAQVAEIKARFQFNLAEHIEWDKIDDKDKHKYIFKISPTYDWASAEIPLSMNLLKVMSAIVVTIASSTGMEYKMDGLWAHTDFMKDIGDLPYKRFFPTVEGGIQLILVSHFPIDYADYYWRFIIHPLIVFNVTRSYYVQETRQRDLTEVDPNLKRRRDETAKLEEENFRVEDVACEH